MKEIIDKSHLAEVENFSVETMPRKKKWAIIAIGFCLMYLAINIGSQYIEIPTNPDFLLFVLIVVFFCTILHECMHGLFFWIYSGKVKFGIKWKTKLGLVTYATSPNSILPRNKMIVTALAPQFLSVLILSIIPLVNGMSGGIAYLLLAFVAMNLGGGCADIYSVYLMIKEKGKIFVEDTGTGMIIYRRGEV